jgi:hypothetical protein
MGQGRQRNQSENKKNRAGCPARFLGIMRSVLYLALDRVGGFGDIMTRSADILTDTANGVASGEREGNDGKK